MRVGGDNPAVDGFKTGSAGDDDVLAELAGERDALFLEFARRLDAPGLDGVEHLLRPVHELVVVRYRLGLAADGDHRALPAVIGDAIADLTLGRLAARALRRLRHAALAQQHDGSV